MKSTEITDHEFSRFQVMLFDIAGISLSSAKKPLVTSRLSKRLREYQLGSFTEYLRLIDGGEYPDEIKTAVDLLTTNETYFFREPNHFEFLRQQLINNRNPNGNEYRIWSAACSTGQEPYSIAMLLDDSLGNRPWEIMASDISGQVLEKARKGLYPIAQAEKIPKPYLSRYCLKGVESQAGSFIIEKSLKSKIDFIYVNLNNELPRLGEFDVIFLRNVMIYFDVEIKRQVISRMLKFLKSDGYLFIGHSETLNGVTNELKMVAPAIYRKP